MRRWITLASVLFFGTLPALAANEDFKTFVPAQTTASTPGATDYYPLVQGGATHKVPGTSVLYAPNNLSDLGAASTARTNLGLGTSATVNTGTSGATIPLLNGNNTFSGTTTLTGTLALGTQTVSGGFTMSGVPIMSGLSAGTQVSCLGLDSGNHIVLNAAACGSGGSSLTINSTTISGGSASKFLYDDGTKLQEGSFGSGLSFSGGTLTATGAGCPASVETWDGTADKTIAATTGLLITTGSTQVAAARVLTLPTIASYTIPCSLTVVDLAGIMNATNAVTPTRASSDTIDGATTGATLASPHVNVEYSAAATAKWATAQGPGITPIANASNQWLNSLGANGIFTQTQPGFSNLSGAATVAQIGGSAASHAVPVDVAGTSTYKVIGDCQDSGGNHLNFTQSTDAFSCGTSSSGGGGGGTPAVGNTTPVTVNANATTAQLLQELHPANGAFNTANMVIKLHQSGIFSTTLTPAVTVTAKLCSSSNSGCVTLATITSATTVTGANNQFLFETSCGVSATGASGTLTCHGTSFVDLTSGSVATTPYSDSNTAASSAFDLTGANFIDFTIAFSSASASNSATGQLAYEAPQGFGGTVTSVVAGTGLSGGTITTTGTVALLAALPNGETATTQTVGDNTTKVATDAFVLANAGGLTCPTGFSSNTFGACTWKQTASASATLDFTGLADSDYTLTCSGLLPATNTSNLYVQLGEGGTPTWKTSGYNWAWRFIIPGSTVNDGDTSSTSDSGFQFVNNVDNTTGGVNILTVQFAGFSLTQHHAMTFAASTSQAAQDLLTFGSGNYSADTTAITGIRVKFSTGNITSGYCTLTLLN